MQNNFVANTQSISSDNLNKKLHNRYEFLNDLKYTEVAKILNSLNACEDVKHKIEDFVYNLLYKESKQINTVMSYLYDLKLSVDFFVEYKNQDISLKTLEQLTRLDFRALYSKRKQSNISPFSQTRLISTWRSFFNFLKYKDVFASLNIKTPKTFPKPVPKDIIDDLLKVDGTWISYRNRALWSLLYGSGMRINEALTLNFKDWKPDAESLEIIGKGKVVRKVPILSMVRNWVEEYLQIYPIESNNDSPLFIGKAYARLSAQTCAHILLKWRRKHNISQVLTPHSLRHSFASHVLANDCNLKVLQEVLGHKNLDTTSRYVQIEDKKLESSFMDIME